MLDWIGFMGGRIAGASEASGYGLRLLCRTTAHVQALARRHYFSALLRQLYIAGILTLPVTLVVSVFTGMILAMNAGLSLEQIGQEGLIGRIVAISITREMGPFMTALILAASVGSGIAAELGTMKVSEEIDALKVMAIDPNRFLVLTRLVAMAVMTPIITIYTDIVGILGGAIIAKSQFGVSFIRFKTEALTWLAAKDVYTGLLKAFVFGIVIAIVGCTQGLRTTGGAIGVGEATRKSVVVSYLLIIVLGYYLTFIFYRIRW